MKLVNQILNPKTAVMVYGRMNPPTLGHEHLINYSISLAEQTNSRPFIFVTKSKDTKNNPLVYEDKIKYLKLGIPRVSEFLVHEDGVRTIFDAINYLISEGFEKIIMVTGADRKEEFERVVKPYINHENPDKRLNLESFDVVSCGNRVTGSGGVAGASSSKIREYVLNNDFERFCELVPNNLNERFAIELFEKVRCGLKTVKGKNMNKLEEAEETERQNRADAAKERHEREKEELKQRQEREKYLAKQADLDAKRAEDQRKARERLAETVEVAIDKVSLDKAATKLHMDIEKIMGLNYNVVVRASTNLGASITIWVYDRSPLNNIPQNSPVYSVFITHLSQGVVSSKDHFSTLKNISWELISIHHKARKQIKFRKITSKKSLEDLNSKMVEWFRKNKDVYNKVYNEDQQDTWKKSVGRR